MISGMNAYHQAEDYGLRPEEAGRGIAARRVAQKDLAPGDPGAAVSQDTVSLSAHVQSARLRESLGLDPTGKTTMGEIREVVARDRDRVVDVVEDSLSRLNLSKEKRFSLSLSEDGRIKVTGFFLGLRKLEGALNDADGFRETFERLDTNSRMIQYTSITDGEKEPALSFLADDQEGHGLNRFLTKYVGTAYFAREDPLREIYESSSSEAYQYELEYNAA